MASSAARSFDMFFAIERKVLQMHCHFFSLTSELFKGVLLNIQTFGEFLFFFIYT